MKQITINGAEHTLHERRPLSADVAGYLESDSEYLRNNNDAAVALLDAALAGGLMPTITEASFMPAVRQTWTMLCNDKELKPGTAKRKAALEQYLQGVLAVAYAIGVFSQDRMNAIYLMVAIGRGEEFLKERT